MSCSLAFRTHASKGHRGNMLVYCNVCVYVCTRCAYHLKKNLSWNGHGVHLTKNSRKNHDQFWISKYMWSTVLSCVLFCWQNLPLRHKTQVYLHKIDMNHQVNPTVLGHWIFFSNKTILERISKKDLYIEFSANLLDFFLTK